jgi:hypothetical protein
MKTQIAVDDVVAYGDLSRVISAYDGAATIEDTISWD